MTKTIFISCILFFVTKMSIAQNTSEVPPPPPLDSSNGILSKVEYEAGFPGGDEAWVKYLQKNLKANTPIKNKAPVGTYQVIVQFIVSRDGSISNITAETSFGYGMEEEVIRVIKKGPKWIPAYQNGRTVNAYRRQPITFMVSEK